jgi:hypothetical protein
MLCAHTIWRNSTAGAAPRALLTKALRMVDATCGGVAVTALANGAMKAMGFAKWQIGAALLVMVGLVAAAAGLGSRDVPGMPPAEAKPEVSPEARAAVRNDLYGDPLPPGALARLGTLRQRAPNSHLAVTADGKEVVSVGPELTVRRFDALTAELRATRQLPEQNSYRTWLSPQGTFLLTTWFREGRAYELPWRHSDPSRRCLTPLRRPTGRKSSARSMLAAGRGLG